ncbi:MAG: hypothetical protein WCO45_12495 [Pseudanabaena sp. ELA607]|jgi:chromosome segregation ATPase
MRLVQPPSLQQIFARCDVRFWLATIFCSFFMVSCGESRISQCNKLVQTVNKMPTVEKEIIKDAAILERTANQLDTVRSELQSLKLKDGRLVTAQSNLASLYRELSQELTNLGKAVSAKDPVAHDKALNALKKVFPKAIPIESEITQYCNG